MKYLCAIPFLFLVSCMGMEQGMKIEKELDADRKQRAELIKAAKEKDETITKLRGEIEHIEADYKEASKAQWERINKAIGSIPKQMDEKVKPLLPADVFEITMKVWRGEIATFTKLLGDYEAKLKAEETNDNRIANFLVLIGKTFAEMKVAPLEAKLGQHIQAQQANDLVKEERLGRLEARAIEAGSKADQAQKTADDTAKTWDDVIVSKVDETGTNQFWMGVIIAFMALGILLYVLRDHIRIPFIGKKPEKKDD